jgi:hypothetical protein
MEFAMSQRVRASFLAAAFVVTGLAACNEDPPPSAWDPEYTSPRPQPVITGIAPEAGLANVSVLTISGRYFDPDPPHNLVFFDNVLVPVLQAASTELLMKAPDLAKDSISVKIGVYRAYLYSEPVLYRLSAATQETGNFQPNEVPVGVECDTAGNAYVSIGGVPASASGVFKITPTGGRSLYSQLFASTVSTWSSMKFGPGGALFCVSARNIIFRIPPGGGTSAIWLSGNTANGLTALYDFDFDREGNIWAGGPASGTSEANKIFRVARDRSVMGFPFAGIIRAIRVFNGYVYAGGRRGNAEKVWRLPIVSADSLGAEEEYFNFSSVSVTGIITAITLDTGGDLYIGTDAKDGIVIVHPTKASEPLYPGVILPRTVSLCWGNGTDLFQSRTSSAAGVASTLVRINMLKSGAPYYGRVLP